MLLEDINIPNRGLLKLRLRGLIVTAHQINVVIAASSSSIEWFFISKIVLFECFSSLKI